MIGIKNHKLFNKRGILIEYDGNKEIFFTDEEAEIIGAFLVNRGFVDHILQNRILKEMENEDSTIEEMSMRFGIGITRMKNEFHKLEKEGRITKTGEKQLIKHRVLGSVSLPVYSLNKGSEKT